MWLRLLALVFGVTVYAASTVLAGFMAGLGVGSFVAGRLAARISRPLAAFGVAEALVGITAFASPWCSSALTRALGHRSSRAARVAGGGHRDPLHGRVPGADRADLADGRDVAAGDQVGGRARGRASAAASACSMPSTPPAPSSARSWPASISSRRSASRGRSGSPPRSATSLIGVVGDGGGVCDAAARQPQPPPSRADRRPTVDRRR